MLRVRMVQCVWADGVRVPSRTGHEQIPAATNDESAVSTCAWPTAVFDSARSDEDAATGHARHQRTRVLAMTYVCVCGMCM